MDMNFATVAEEMCAAAAEHDSFFQAEKDDYQDGESWMNDGYDF